MMKSLLISGGFLVLVATGTAFGQEVPNVADNATPIDNNIKLRSVELERVKRAAARNATVRRQNGTEISFSIVKKDFEGIQKKQTKIVKAYTTGKTIDYKKIRKYSGKITEDAIRLKSALFDGVESKKTEEKKPAAKTLSVRDLIVMMDNSIGSFVTNPMFKNLKVVDKDNSAKALVELNKIIDLSGRLWLESSKMAAK